MADDFDPDAYLAKKQQGAFDPDAYLAKKGATGTAAQPEGLTLGRAFERAGEAAGETFMKGARAWLPESKEEAQNPLTMLGKTHQRVVSPFTMTLGPAFSGAGSLLASGVSEAARRITGGDEKRSEEMYEYALPMGEAALGAVGRVPGVAGAGRFPMPDTILPRTTKVPAKGPEAEAGRIIEGKASDPDALRQKLAAGPQDTVPGEKLSTFEVSEGDQGIGQLTKGSAQRPGMVEQFLEQKAGQNTARHQALERMQPTGDPAAVSQHLRNTMRTETAAADQEAALAQQRAWEATRQIGGENDPATYGNVLRRELRIAEDAARERERDLWRAVDPDGTLRANPQPIQELERGIYGPGNMSQAGAASITPAEREIAALIQNYPPVIPFQELRDLRSLTSTALREELYGRGQTPAYGRLSRLRQGIEEAIPNTFTEEGQIAAGAQERLRAASAATRERAETFRPLRDVTRREGVEGPYRMGEASVPGRLVQSGARGYDSASAYLRAVGNERGLPELQDAIAASMRREVIGTDGMVNPRKLEGWLRRYQDTLRAIDERDGGAFSQRLRNIGTAQDAIEAAEARQAAVAKKYKDDQFKALTGATEEADIARMIGGLFGRTDSVARARDLMRRLSGNDAAVEGLRAAIVRHIRERLVGNAALGEDPLIRAEQFQNWVRYNKSALRVIMDPAQVQSMEDIARSLQRAARINQTKAVGAGSDTVQNILAQAEQTSAFKEGAKKAAGIGLRILAHMVAQTAGPVGGATLSALGESGLAAMRASRAARKAKRIETIQDLVDDAMLNPERARELLGKTHTYRDKTPGAKTGAAYGLGAESARERRLTREAGGGVPALGGTGGRSPGTTTPAGPRAARQGTGQALSDGGAAGEQQAAPLSGSRERLAAALAASPAGGEFSSKIAGKTGAEKKKPSPLGREDIVKQLQSRGLSTEGWGAPSGFGESRVPSVDSRADGGRVDDGPWIEEGQFDKTTTDPALVPLKNARPLGKLPHISIKPGGKYPISPGPSGRADPVFMPGQTPNYGGLEKDLDYLNRTGRGHVYADGGEVDEPPLPDPLLEAESARTAAAMRLAGGARPAGGRREGATTEFLTKGLPILTRAAADKPEHYWEAAKGLAGRVASIPERMMKAGRQMASGEYDPETGEQRFDPSGPGDLALFGAGARMPVKAAPGETVLGAGRVRRTGGRRPPTEPPDEPPPPIGHNMPPGEALPVERRRTSSLSLRDMPIEQAIKQAQTEAHIIPSNPKVREGYVGAPDWVKTPEDLARMRAQFDAQVEAGTGGAKWYQEAQSGIKEMAGPDPKKQHLLAQQKAVTSAQATPETNLGFALQGHNAAITGKPLDIVRTGDIGEKIAEGEKTGEIRLGRKTGIYARHMDPTMEDPSTGTNDIWHARSFGYENPEGGLGAQQHAFMDAETVLAVARANAKKLGGRSDWTPGEIQAAPWVFNKAQGLQEQFGWSPEKAMAEAVKTYNSYFDKHTAFGTHEATPGVGTRHLPKIAQGTEAERGAFAADPRSSWRDPSGRDIMYQSLGMYVRPSVKATGVFEGPEGLEINPAEAARPMVSFEGAAGKRQVDPASRRLMDAAEAARAYMDVQNAGAWSIPIEKQQVGQSTSAYLRRPGGGPLPIGDIGKLQAIGARHGLPGVIDYGEGTALTSFGGGPTGKQLGKSTLPQEVEAATGIRPTQVKLDTGYIDYQSLWGGKQGTGAVTRALQEHLISKDAPAILKRLDASPELRQAVAARMERDAEIARQTGQPIRRDVQRARAIFIKSGFEGLFRALAKGAALPAVAFAPLVEALREQEAPVE